MPTKVITLDESSFKTTCTKLEESVRQSDFEPDCVLSIANGGVYVGNEIFQELPHLSTKLQRASTERKSRFRYVFKHLPRCVLDYMRIFESWIRQISPPDREQRHTDVSIPDLRAYSRILIVDDAVDSGATLHRIVNSIRLSYPSAELHCAVITVTTRQPMITPDYFIYKSILIRFPWSMDA